MDYPYQNQYLQYMNTIQEKNKITIKNNDYHLKSFFYYESLYNRSFIESGYHVDSIVESDIREFLVYIGDLRNLTIGSTNQYLYSIAGYYKYLFRTEKTKVLPTLDVIGLPTVGSYKVTIYDVGWIDSLQDLLENERIDYYTRFFLLFTARFYKLKEILAEDFYKIANKEMKNAPEYQQIFFYKFRNRIRPLQQKYKTKALLIQRRSQSKDNYLISTNQQLSRYLQRDKKWFPFITKTRELYRTNIIYYLETHPDISEAVLKETLHMNQQTLDWYRRLAKRYFK
ncbi:hypothetical protein [Ligilactobacillus equi]|nr:hypothetical protein [Ligilactobacillus equi]